MPFQSTPAPVEPSLDEIAALDVPVLLEFGTPWCGWCRAAQPLIAAALNQHPRVRHIKIEDGSGRQLGRHFGVKLWPTLVVLHHGREVAKFVRVQDGTELLRALAALAALAAVATPTSR